VRLLKLMNPVESSRTPESAGHFKGEPYVSPADVSSAAGHVGRAGWTWYTGSAGWMYRIWIEEVLGFQLHGDTLTMTPAIPDDWDGFEMTYRHRSSVYEIQVRRNAPENGSVPAGAPIELLDDGATHKVVVRLARTAPLAVETHQENAVPA
jgi:cyclic beta-1,2-glucan synthetase